MTIERTLAIIKPDAWPQHGGAILTTATEAGLVPVEMKIVNDHRVFPVGDNMTEVWKQFYAEHRDRPFFPSLVEFMASGPVLAMVLEGEDAVARWRARMGPTDSRKAGPNTIRGRFGQADPMWCGREPVYALGWRRAVHTWRPLTLYAMQCAFCSAMRHDVESAVAAYPMWRNAVHGSDSPEAAKREIAFFFGGG